MTFFGVYYNSSNPFERVQQKQWFFQWFLWTLDRNLRSVQSGSGLNHCSGPNLDTTSYDTDDTTREKKLHACCRKKNQAVRYLSLLQVTGGLHHFRYSPSKSWEVCSYFLLDLHSCNDLLSFTVERVAPFDQSLFIRSQKVSSALSMLAASWDHHLWEKHKQIMSNHSGWTLTMLRSSRPLSFLIVHMVRVRRSIKRDTPNLFSLSQELTFQSVKGNHTEFTMPVTKGDILTIDAATLTEKEVHVVWQQSLRSRSQDYYLVTYNNTTRGESLAPSVALSSSAHYFCSVIATESEHSGLLFIQKNMLDGFKAKQVSGQKEITFKVDDSFQYGQDMSKKNRWIAFHDKSQKMFQVCSILLIT